MSRAIINEDWGRGHYRTPPLDAAWTRRYLRNQLYISFDNDADLDELLASLDPADFARLKAAWRKRDSRRREAGEISADMGRAFTLADRPDRQLCGLWAKAVDLGLIQEEHAIALIDDMQRNGHNVATNGGCQFMFQFLLGAEARRVSERHDKELMSARSAISMSRQREEPDEQIRGLLEKAGVPADVIKAAFLAEDARTD
jgi:hypothetical protein